MVGLSSTLIQKGRKKRTEMMWNKKHKVGELDLSKTGTFRGFAEEVEAEMERIRRRQEGDRGTHFGLDETHKGLESLIKIDPNAMTFCDVVPTPRSPRSPCTPRTPRDNDSFGCGRLTPRTPKTSPKSPRAMTPRSSFTSGTHLNARYGMHSISPPRRSKSACSISPCRDRTLYAPPGLPCITVTNTSISRWKNYDWSRLLAFLCKHRHFLLTFLLIFTLSLESELTLCYTLILSISISIVVSMCPWTEMTNAPSLFSDMN
eukprot:TRINITY_DN5167_c3_g1_i1.p1 TRINITY_DN5167_c3_g1~~TRINITY_DN5167_c3_g1_i1.p1  ORF type:complete len:261 (+),score=33.38 TRINITY_DN5167_c3_g1_i1:43-825(+)